MKIIGTKPGGKAFVETILALAMSSDRVLLYITKDQRTHRLEPEEWRSFQVVLTGSDLEGMGATFES